MPLTWCLAILQMTFLLLIPLSQEQLNLLLSMKPTTHSSPLTSLPLTHFPRWLSSLPVPLILPSPETSSNNYPHTFPQETALKNRLQTRQGLDKQREEPGVGIKGLSSRTRMAHSPRLQDSSGVFLVQPSPWLVSPRVRDQNYC